jgi:hypothetical protein
MPQVSQEVRAASSGLSSTDRLPKRQKLVVRFGPAISFRTPVLPATSGFAATRTLTTPLRPLGAGEIA